MRQVLEQFTRRTDQHVLVQFTKYALCGVVSAAVDVGAFYTLAWKIVPALSESDPVVKLLHLSGPFADEAVRSRNFAIVRVLAFAASSLTAYVLNVLWVFEPGRHRRHVEVALFYAVSIAGLALSTFLGWAAIDQLKLQTTSTYIINVGVCLVINFLGRKYIIFRG